jgi:ABC-2 type transport system permease protein
MNARRTFAITRRLLSQFRNDHRTLGILFVTPLLILGVFALLFRSDAPVPTVGLVVVSSPVSELIASGLEGSETLSTVRVASAADADAQLRDGSLDAYLVLPAPDADGVLRPEVVVEGTNPSVAGAVPAALQRAVLDALSSYAPPLPPGMTFKLPRVEPQVRTLYGNGELDVLDVLGGPFIGLVVFLLVYVVTSVSFLRERTVGTLERLMATPLRRTEIVVGYMAGFIVVALVQSAEVLGFGLLVIGLYNAGSVWLIFAIELILALSAVSLGIFLSTFARNEFQAVQFIPLVVVPQILLSGVIVPVSAEPDWLQVVSNVLPLTYAVDGLREVMLRGADLSVAAVQRDLAVLIGFCVLLIAAAALTLRREVA